MLSAGIAKNQGLVKLDLSDNAIQSRYTAAASLQTFTCDLDAGSATRFPPHESTRT